MRRILHAAAGAFVLAAAVVVPTGPATADSIRDQQWYLTSLKVSQAHAISTGAGVTVAIIDAGVAPHRDFDRNLLPGFNEVTGKSDGRSDTIGHGTGMAGIIAAHGHGGNNGVLGIAPAAKLMPIKAANNERITGDAIAAGIDYAVSHKARVINISLLGAPAFSLLKAVKAANAADVVVVAGSGNNGNTGVGYPAAVSGVLAVGATDKSGKYWPDSNYGPSLQICAPGVDIISTGLGNGYRKAEGTSDSTAVVSGAVALVRAKFPQLSAAEVIHRITATADDIGPPGRDDQCGYGELNIVKALTADVPPLSGDTGASASPSASAGATEPTAAPATGNAAPPATTDKSSNGPLIAGVVIALLVAGALVGFVVMRRRRS